MEEILKLILVQKEPIALILSLSILGIIGVVLLYLKTLKRVMKNDFHEVPDILKSIDRRIEKQNDKLDKHLEYLIKIYSNTSK